MIIKIEDAPNIKNLKIDINFEDSDSPITISSTTENSQNIEFPSKPKEDIALNLDEDFNISEEVVEKPEIPDIDRDVKVSDEMINAEF